MMCIKIGMKQISPASKRLSEHLKDCAISQRDFAEQVGSKQSIISRLIGGSISPSLKLAINIESATDGAVPASLWVNAEATQ